MNPSNDRTLASRRPNPVMRLLASIRFGVTTLVLILVYASIGSALAPVRGALELSEMQVFQHWLFITLIALFSASLVAATATRIRWSLVNAGGITVHVGLLMLVGGAAWYFGGKVEGDVLLISPRIEVLTADGQALPGIEFLAETGQTWRELIPPLGGSLSFEVLGTRSSGLDVVAQAEVRVTLADRPPLVVTLTANASEPTRLGGSGLALRLRTFPPQSAFYDTTVPALYYGRTGAGTPHFVELRGLPLHRERYVSGGGLLHDSAGRVVPSKRASPYVALGSLKLGTGWFEPWQMPLDLDTPELPFDIVVTGYVPYILGMRETVSGGHGEPVIQPLELRRPNVGRAASAIRLKLTGRGELAGWSESRWCMFSSYPYIDQETGLAALAASPITVRLPDGSQWELVYSRAERDLGTTLVPGKLSVKFFPGRHSPESWRSDFCVKTDDRAELTPAAVYTNHTWTIGPWTLFQANASGDHWSWTELGAGNRRGMSLMTIGSVLITLGCLYAFYVKPILRRPARGTGKRG